MCNGLFDGLLESVFNEIRKPDNVIMQNNI